MIGSEPPWLAQPTIAIIGTIPALLALPLVRGLGIGLGRPPRRTVVAATLAGVVFATESLYLQRTVTVSYEVLGPLFVPPDPKTTSVRCLKMP